MHECKTVTLRTRPLKGRMMSFYLDYYPGYRDKETMKVIRHESLGIYIYANPRNKREQNFNEVMTEKAEAIRCRRFESVVNERYDFFDKYKLKADFLEYYRILNGSTQVNSTEVNSMPMPPMTSIEAMGKELIKVHDMSEASCDRILRSYV